MRLFKSKPILLAEANDGDVRRMERIFKRFGITDLLFVVNTGDDAIKFLTGEEPYADRRRYPFPSLLILDLEMPRKSGLAVLDWIRHHPALENLFVVIFTNGLRIRETTKIFEQHANTCILNSHFMKPATEANVEMLLQLFESWLKTQKK